MVNGQKTLAIDSKSEKKSLKTYCYLNDTIEYKIWMKWNVVKSLGTLVICEEWKKSIILSINKPENESIIDHIFHGAVPNGNGYIIHGFGQALVQMHLQQIYRHVSLNNKWEL